MNTAILLTFTCLCGFAVGLVPDERLKKSPLNCGPVCAIYCEYGNIPDDRGCPTCNCRPRPCAMMKCRPCRYGYALDEIGCQTCRCKPRPCYRRKCWRKCPNGYKKNRRGRQTCTCADIPGRSPQCNEPKKVGPCEALVPRYFYNQKTGNCERFDWGGCQANGNNFESEAVCRGVCVCGPVCLIFCQYGNIPDERGCPTCRCRTRPCPAIKCAYPCSNGRAVDEMGCQTCKCKGCLDSKKVGPCKARKRRYFYNKVTQRCEMFYWGGCQPNGNNFKTLIECTRSCHA